MIGKKRGEKKEEKKKKKPPEHPARAGEEMARWWGGRTFSVFNRKSSFKGEKKVRGGTPWAGAAALPGWKSSASPGKIFPGKVKPRLSRCLPLRGHLSAANQVPAGARCLSLPQTPLLLALLLLIIILIASLRAFSIFQANPYYF